MRYFQVAAVALITVVVTAAPPAPAATDNLLTTENAAAQACGADEVVWVDLDRGRFYRKGQAEYAKGGNGGNGGYGCLKQAGAKYRPARAQ